MNDLRTFFLLTGALSCLLLIIGLIMPYSMLWWEDVQNRRKVIKLYGTAALMSILLYSVLRYIHMKHLILPCLTFTIVLLACSGPSKNKVADEPIPPERNDLPKMTVLIAGGSEVHLNHLKGNTIIILFQPDCDHCQREAKEIRQYLGEFKDYALYFISSDQLPSIEEFAKSYDLLGHPNVNFASTTVNDVIKNFGPIPAPSIYIYSDRRLVKKFNGEVAIETILQAI